MWSRRDVLVGAAGVTAAAALTMSVRADTDARAAAVRRPGTAFRFVSSPDLFNSDIADLSSLPTWDGGLNSTNEAWDIAIETCLGAVAGFGPDAFFVAGDLVQGHWNFDSDRRRLFGEASREPTKEGIRAAGECVRNAGEAYYGYYDRLMRRHGLDLYAAVGDHELLDDRPGALNDRWSPYGNAKNGKPDNRYYLVEACKDVWADHFTRDRGTPRFENRPAGPLRDTAYAVSFADALTLITVDVFDKTPAGVRLGVFGAQLAWLREQVTLAKLRGHVVVVQGHIPIVTPYRIYNSGNLHVPGGVYSDYYRALEECGADFLFCGEVHDTTLQQVHTGAPVQISHGCLFGGGFNFIVGDVMTDGTVHIDLYEIPQLLATRDHTVWQTQFDNRLRTSITYGEPEIAGRLTYVDGQITRATKKLGPYHPFHDVYDHQNHKTTIYL